MLVLLRFKREVHLTGRISGLSCQLRHAWFSTRLSDTLKRNILEDKLFREQMGAYCIIIYSHRRES